ncbi:MAG: SH3 domain-containing protein [Gammaproteobacteria bacterium]|nr:SH3 domain-containing protein [Gammaproteobacteria bacterium]
MSEPSITTIPSTPRLISSLWCGCLVAVVLQIFLPAPAAAADEYRTVTIADPYIEMRTGPGRGYPIFHVVDRGEVVDVIKQRTEWYLVRADNGKQGWVDRAQMEQTLQPDGNRVSFDRAGLEDFTNAKWELGLLAGDFGGANIISLYGGYSLNPNVSVELWGSQILGNFSNGWMGSINVVHEAFPEWRVSPFFTLGAGMIHTSPKSTIVQGEDRTDQIGHVGAGVRVYATRRFLLRAEYKSYVVFTSRDENEEVEEWKVGFAFFF